MAATAEALGRLLSWARTGRGPAIDLVTPERRCSVPGAGRVTVIELELGDETAWLPGRATYRDLPGLPDWL